MYRINNRNKNRFRIQILAKYNAQINSLSNFYFALSKPFNMK